MCRPCSRSVFLPPRLVTATPPPFADASVCMRHRVVVLACFRYRRLPVYDNAGQAIGTYLSGCVEFIKTGLHYGSVLVHCVQGVSRSATVVVAYVMKERSMDLDTALEFCRLKRPQVRSVCRCFGYVVALVCRLVGVS